MIGFIEGIVEYKEKDKVTVSTDGVGYEIFVPNINNLPEPGNEIKVYTYFHVTDDSQSLYGFLSPDEKQFFLSLLKIPDIGPKVAMSIMSNIEINRLKAAVVNKDIKMLQTIPRIGKKLAERIIVELKDKLAKEDIISRGIQSSIDESMEHDLIDALVSLGYNITTAKNTLDKVRSRFLNTKPNINELIKECLKELAK